MIEVILVSLVVLVGLFFAALFGGAAMMAGRHSRWRPDLPGLVYQWFARGVLSLGVVALSLALVLDVARVV